MSYESYLEAAGKRVWLVDNLWHVALGGCPLARALATDQTSDLQSPRSCRE